MKLFVKTMPLLILVTAAQFILAQSGNFHRMYSYPDNVGTTSVYTTPDGGLILCGRQVAAGNNYYTKLIRTNGAGDFLYSVLLAGSRWSCNDILMESDGGFVITGGTNPSTTNDFYAARYYPNGQQAWIRTTPIGTGANAGVKIAKNSTTGNYEFVVTALPTGQLVTMDSLGNTISTTTYVPAGLDPKPNSPYFTTAPNPPTGIPYAYNNIKLQVLDSSRTVVKQMLYVVQQSVSYFLPTDYIVHTDGSYYLMADTNNGINGSCLIKWDTSGALQYCKPIVSSMGVLRNCDIIELHDGTLMIVGNTSYAYASFIHVAPNGNILSQRHYKTPQGWALYPTHTIQLPDHSLVTSDDFASPSQVSYAGILKTDYDGNLRYSQVQGQAYYDENSNHQRDSLEIGIAMKKIYALSNNDITLSKPDGSFEYAVFDTGLYVFRTDTLLYWQISDPVSGYDTVHFSQFNQCDTVQFAFTKTTDVRDLALDLNYHWLVHGRPSLVYGFVENKGNTRQDSVRVDINFDRLRVLGSNRQFDSLGNGMYRFYLGNLLPTQSLPFYIDCLAAIDTFNIGDSACVFANTYGMFADTTLWNNVDTLCMGVVGPYDPNNKTVEPVGNVNKYIDPDTRSLTYQINFQNTGSSEAHNVILVDTLETDVVPYSIELLAYSHPVSYTVKGNIVKFNFIDIMLPDSTSNEPASHGYVRFKVDLAGNLPSGTSVSNFADIYFDFNIAVRTDTPTVILYEEPTALPDMLAGNGLSVYPNPGNYIFNVSYTPTTAAIFTLNVFDLTGHPVFSKSEAMVTSTTYTTSINATNWPQGIYFLHVAGGSESQVVKIVKQ